MGCSGKGEDLLWQKMGQFHHSQRQSPPRPHLVLGEGGSLWHGREGRRVKPLRKENGSDSRDRPQAPRSQPGDGFHLHPTPDTGKERKLPVGTLPGPSESAHMHERKQKKEAQSRNEGPSPGRRGSQRNAWQRPRGGEGPCRIRAQEHFWGGQRTFGQPNPGSFRICLGKRLRTGLLLL